MTKSDSKPQAVSWIPDSKVLAEALDLPEAVKPVQDAYWQARREWTELQNAYLRVIEEMTKIHADD